MDRSPTLSQAAKTIFYNSNGSGRDSYIVANHGGLVASQVRNIQPEKGTMDTREIHIKTSKPYLHSKPVSYLSDGTGRDSYIVRPNGGLYNEYVPGSMKAGFYNSLRHYDRERGSMSPSRKSLSPSGKKDVFLSSQNHFNSTQMSNIKKVKTYQKILDNRLSKPKYIKKVEKI